MNNTVNTKNSGTNRLGSIDGLRGLLLLAMCFNHLILWPFANLKELYHYSYQPLGFLTAAEGFFFISGLIIAFSYTSLFYKKGGLAAIKTKLISRIIKLYLVNLALAMAVVWLFFHQLAANGIMRNIVQEYELLGSLSYLELLVLINPPWLTDILPAYIIFMPLSILLLYAAKHRGGQLLALVAMLLLWCVGQFYPFATLSRLYHQHFAPHSLSLGWFELASWQLVFTSAFVIGLNAKRGTLPRWLAYPPLWLYRTCLGIAGLFVVQRHFGAPFPPSWFETFAAAQNLGPLRVINFASLAIIVRYHWTAIAPHLDNHVLTTIGRNSLTVFVYHVILVYGSAYTLQHLPNTPSHSVLLAACVLLVMSLYGVAYLRNEAAGMLAILQRYGAAIFKKAKQQDIT